MVLFMSSVTIPSCIHRVCYEYIEKESHEGKKSPSQYNSKTVGPVP